MAALHSVAGAKSRASNGRAVATDRGIRAAFPHSNRKVRPGRALQLAGGSGAPDRTGEEAVAWAYSTISSRIPRKIAWGYSQ